jgi:asparagine synthase (glutamine-hydrolysing)
MCGIFALINNSFFDINYVKDCFQKGKNRGPEYSEYIDLNENLDFGFHRLAINGLNEQSNQPMTINNITLICNGEIYNFQELFSMINMPPQTNSDCEIIIHLYQRFGIEYTLSLLDGYFSFVLYDGRQKNSTVYIARDAYGVRPLYILKPTHISPHSNYVFAVASELKMLSGLLNFNNCELSNDSGVPYHIEQYNPGTYSKMKLHENMQYKFEVYAKTFSTFSFDPHYDLVNHIVTPGEYYNAYSTVYHALNNAVKKRVVGTTDRPIACLLSGGLDSSLIAALVSKYYDKKLETYSIGMPGGEDLKFARIVADHIGSKHTEIIVSEDDFFNAIPDVIKTIESYDTTSVRASVGNYLVSKYISKNSNAKVIFNGDGSDELTGGYLYFHAAPDALSFDCEVKRLLSDIHFFDVLRSDKSISSNGLEPRTPFLDREWVQTYLSIPIRYRYNPNRMEKWLLRKSVEIMEPDLLPNEVLWRTKEAFSDGVSSQSKSWYEIITERIDNMSKNYDEQLNIIHNSSSHLLPITKEQIYYRKLFDEYYPNCYNVVPYFWMPRFVEANDASARTLNIYKKLTTQ